MSGKKEKLGACTVVLADVRVQTTELPLLWYVFRLCNAFAASIRSHGSMQWDQTHLKCYLKVSLESRLMGGKFECQIFGMDNKK